MESNCTFWTSLAFSQAGIDQISENRSQSLLSDGGLIRSADVSVFYWTFQLKHALKHQICLHFRWPYTGSTDSHLVLCYKRHAKGISIVCSLLLISWRDPRSESSAFLKGTPTLSSHCPRSSMIIPMSIIPCTGLLCTTEGV